MAELGHGSECSWRDSAVAWDGSAAEPTLPVPSISTSARRPARTLVMRRSAKPAVAASVAIASAWAAVRPCAEWPRPPGLASRSASSSRPPGLSTRLISRIPACRSCQWWRELSAQTTVTAPSGSGKSSARPRIQATRFARRNAVSHRASRNIAGAGSTPAAEAPLRAASRTAVPGPQPMSTTRSASVRRAAAATARAVGPRPTVIEIAVSTSQVAARAPRRRWSGNLVPSIRSVQVAQTRCGISLRSCEATVRAQSRTCAGSRQSPDCFFAMALAGKPLAYGESRPPKVT